MAIKERDNMYKRFKRTGEDSDWETYKTKRNKVVTVIRQEQCKYYEEKIDACKSDSRKMWKSLKNIISKKHDEPFTEVQFGHSIFSDKNEICENFNDFVVNSIHGIIGSIPDNALEYKVAEFSGEKFNDFHLVSKDELKKFIVGLANKSSPDDIDMWIYKENFDVLSDSLLNIVNSSLESGEVPHSLKVATVIPIGKVPKTIKAEECRPINILPAFEKILEKTVYLQILEFIKNKHILDNFQSGFRENFGCESALQYVINEWKEANDKERMTGVVFLDLKRAFETVDRELLLYKLGKFGFGGKVLKWFRCYLDERKQKVKCVNVKSGEKAINVGVPQGSILGPILFILYINDMGRVFKNCKYHFFADDTVLYLDETDPVKLINKINEHLELVRIWLENNRLKLNITKTKSMLIANQNSMKYFRDNGLAFDIQGNSLDIVSEIKYLGVIIDSSLSFKRHIDYICKKISKKIGVLRRVSWYLSITSRKLVYNSIILPHFTYCSTILYMANQTDLNRLQKLQNRAMRVILKCSIYTSISGMLDCLKWLNISQFIVYNVLIFIHKISIDTNIPEYLKHILSKFDSIHQYNTRGKHNFIIKQAKKSATYCSVFYKGATEYNKLSTDFKRMNLDTFKRQLKLKLWESKI